MIGTSDASFSQPVDKQSYKTPKFGKRSLQVMTKS